MEPLIRCFALAVELAHALLMLLWALGLPLLLWHGYPRLTRAYLWFSLSFITLSVISHQWLGECALTALARQAWQAVGGYPERVPFIVSLTNRIAGIRPSARAAVLAWQLGITVYCVALLCYWRKTGGMRGRGRLKRLERQATLRRPC